MVNNTRYGHFVIYIMSCCIPFLIKLIFGVGIFAVVLLVVVTKLFFGHTQTDDELFEKAHNAVGTDGRMIQLAADNIFSNWEALPFNEYPGVAPSGTILDSLGKSLSNRVFKRCTDNHDHKRILQWRFGNRRNYSWLIIYPSWEDVSDVKDVRWISHHIAVRDESAEYSAEWGGGDDR